MGPNKYLENIGNSRYKYSNLFYNLGILIDIFNLQIKYVIKSVIPTDVNTVHQLLFYCKVRPTATTKKKM